MIPKRFIEEWQTHKKWQTITMVEQDLIISRALICLYNNPIIQSNLVFRGGTALNKLYFIPPARYSEDIDFVQKTAEPIGQTITAIRSALDSWLGEPKRKITERSFKLVYRYIAITGEPAKLKIEINTTEHFQVLPLQTEPFSINSEWFRGECTIITYALEELIATKMRALYQRRKGRDLFDLWFVFSQQHADIDTVISIFQKYCAQEGSSITKELFQKNLEFKRLQNDFQVDMYVLLPHQTHWDFEEAFEFVYHTVIGKI